MPGCLGFQVINKQKVLVIALSADKRGAGLEKQHIARFEADIPKVAGNTLPTPGNGQHNRTVTVPEPGVANGQPQHIGLGRQCRFNQTPFRPILAQARLVFMD